MKYLIASTIILSMFFLSGCCSMSHPKKLTPLPDLFECEGAEIPVPERSTFHPDGHMLTTFVVARFAGLSEEDTYALTFYSQVPDLDGRFDAIHVSLNYLLVPWRWDWRRDINRELHSLHGGNDAEVQFRREYLGELIRLKLLKPKAEALQEAGLMIHAFADSYAHTDGEYLSKNEQAYGPLYGHLFKGTFPDQIAQREVFQKYKGYVTNLFNILDTKKDPKQKKLMEDYLCSLSHYVCEDKCKCNCEAVKKMESAIATWTLRMGFAESEFDKFYKDPRMTKCQVQKVMNEIKRGPY